MLYVQDVRARHGPLEEPADPRHCATRAQSEADPGAHRRAGRRRDRQRARGARAGQPAQLLRAPTRATTTAPAFRSMGFGLPVDEFFPERKKLLLAEGRPRDDAAASCGDEVAELRAQGKNRADWGRFAVEWHKKFAIPSACLVFGAARARALARQQEGGALRRPSRCRSAVIFVYYVLIRLGEQAGDTGAMQPWLAMWGANVVLGALALAAAAAQPPRGGLRPARCLALPALRSPRSGAGAPRAAPWRARSGARRRRGRWWWSGSRASACASRPSSIATSRAPGSATWRW